MTKSYRGVEVDRLSSGMCMDCGSPRGDTGTTLMCRSCADRHNKYIKKCKDKNREIWSKTDACSNCGSERDDNNLKLCARCRDLGRQSAARTNPQRKAYKRANKICQMCKNPTFNNYTAYCQRHFLYSIVCKYDVPESLWDALWKTLEDQNFRCFYTGRELIPGLNCSIDHMNPPKRGGSISDISNMVWCDRGVNSRKGNMTAKEFIEFCATVFDYSTRDQNSEWAGFQAADRMHLGRIPNWDKPSTLGQVAIPYDRNARWLD